jgi:hypothetical protein
MSELKLVEGNQYVYRNGKKCKLVHWDEAAQIWVSMEIGDCRSKFSVRYHNSDGVSSHGREGDIVAEYIEPPKPMEVWVNLYEYPDGSEMFGSVYRSEDIAKQFATGSIKYRTIHFREVME